jgi:hypothetical protein
MMDMVNIPLGPAILPDLAGDARILHEQVLNPVLNLFHPIPLNEFRGKSLKPVDTG